MGLGVAECSRVMCNNKECESIGCSNKGVQHVLLAIALSPPPLCLSRKRHCMAIHNRLLAIFVSCPCHLPPLRLAYQHHCMNADDRVLAIFVWMAALLLVNWLLILLLWWVWGDGVTGLATVKGLATVVGVGDGVKGLGAGHIQGGGGVIVFGGCVHSNYATCSRNYLLPLLPVFIFCFHFPPLCRCSKQEAAAPS